MTAPLSLPTLDEARALGAKLTAVDPSMLKPTPGVSRRWFHGGEAYLEVTVDEDARGLLHLEVCVRGRFARWRRDKGTTTGGTDELELSHGMPSSKRERLDDDPSKPIIAVCRAVLEGNDALRLYADRLVA